MGRHYSHLGLAERRQIAVLLEAKVPVSEIARRLGRHRSTIHREVGRNYYYLNFRDRWGQEYSGYYAVAANARASRRRVATTKLSRRPTLREHVLDRLRDGWSPQQIAGRLKRDPHPEGRVSHETSTATSTAGGAARTRCMGCGRWPAVSAAAALAASRGTRPSRPAGASPRARLTSRRARYLAIGKVI